jgi:hypothetical protein
MESTSRNRPVESDGISVDNPAPTAFQNTKTVIAIDASGSTRGKVIEQEIKAAQSICGTLSEAAAAQTTIIPWDHRTHTFTSPNDVDGLKSYGGGTKPSSLTSNLNSVYVLRKCSAWMLFTDGKIADKEIRDFSQGLCTNGLHGTACIVVLFGRRYRKPVDCNVSVGISIFGMVPNCLFLFHDVDSGMVSMLQSKGVFSRLLPEGYGTLALDDDSDWCELPIINYSDLSQIDIPAPRKLGSGDILLQSNRTVRLDDVYNDTVDDVTANELLEVEDNLKTLLLTSEINGKRDSVKTWIFKQKMKRRDMLSDPRPDIGNTASNCIRELLLLGTGTLDLDKRRSLQAKLLIAHKQNWIAFLSETDAEHTRFSRREAVVHSALDRITSNAVESDQNSWSARMFAPIVSSGPKKSLAGISAGSKLPPTPSNPVNMSYQPSSSKSPMDPLSRPLRCDMTYLKDSSTNSEPTPHSSPNTDLLFIPGYKHKRGPDAMAAFEGECALCGDLHAILALLVKDPPTEWQSEEFPKPDSNAMPKFPLAIGAYPEARVLSSFVCCDACAYHLVKMQNSPHGENILGAIPLIHEAFAGAFRQMTLDTLDKALFNRFEKSALEQIFLSILYNTLLDAKEECEDIAKKGLRWAASLLATSISIPSTLSPTLTAGQLSDGDKTPLREALSKSFEELTRPSSPLLQYPLGGFVVLIQSMIDLKLDPSAALLKKAVFQRILYHVTERYHGSLLREGRETATQSFHSLIWSGETGAQTQGSLLSDEAFDIISTPHLSVPISFLSTHHFLSAEDMEALRKLGLFFLYVEETCSSALAVFLHVLCKEQAETASTPMQMFDGIRSREIFHAVFEFPQSIGEAEAKELVDLICFGTIGESKILPESAGDANEGGLDGEFVDFDMLSEEF